MKSNVEWEQWGRDDPLYGVAAWPGREKGGVNPWSEEDFFATGAADWKDYLAQWEPYGLDATCCLEIGCGAGRLTKWLAEYFERVHAVDISKDVVDIARRHVPDDSVTFHVTDGLALPLPDSTVSAVLSTFVFQHFDSPAIAREYLVEIGRVMRPGGSLMIQMPIYEWAGMRRLFRGMYEAQRSFGTVRATVRRLLIRRGIGSPIMRGLKYEVSWVLTTFSAIGFENIEIRTFQVRSNGDWHSFIFARKPDDID